MSYVQPSTVQLIAESVDVASCSHEAAKALAPHVDMRLREVLQEATKFMRHSKRDTLTTDDINRALRIRNVEPVFGFGGSKDPLRFLRAAGHPHLFYVEDPVRPIEEAIDVKMPKPPTEVSVMAHWLAIDGVQPRIPENMRATGQSQEVRSVKRQRLDAAALPQASPPGEKDASRRAPAPDSGGPVRGASGAGLSGAAPAEVLPPLRHRVSEELQQYYKRVQAILFEVPEETGTPASSSGGIGGGLAGGASVGTGPQGQASQAQIDRPPVDAILAGLATDPGLQDLLPYMVQDIDDCVQRAVLPGGPKTAHVCIPLMLKAIGALVVNERLELGPCLSKLLPLLITVVVVARMGLPLNHWHWGVRDRAASLLALLISKHRHVLPRVTKSFVNGLQDGSKPLTSHYGCIRGIQSLGPHAVRLHLLPNLRPYLEHLHKRANADRKSRQSADGQVRQGDASWQKSQDAAAVFGALQEAVGQCVHHLLCSRQNGHQVASGYSGLSPKVPDYRRAVPVHRCWQGERWSASSRGALISPSMQFAAGSGDAASFPIQGPAHAAPAQKDGGKARDRDSKAPLGQVDGAAATAVPRQNGAAEPHPRVSDAVGAIGGESGSKPPFKEGTAHEMASRSDGKGPALNALCNGRLGPQTGSPASPGSGGATKRIPSNGLLAGKPVHSSSLKKQTSNAPSPSSKISCVEQKRGEENPLEGGWHEDGDIRRIVALAVDIFGDAMIPYMPTEMLNGICL